jgi:HEAT repeat protein
MQESEIRRLLRSRRTEDRIRAVGHMETLPESVRVPLLLETLEDTSKYVAAMAAERLRDVTDWRVAPLLVETFLKLSAHGLKNDPGCHIRGRLAFALGKMEFPGATDALRIGIRTRQIEAVGGVPFDTGAHLRANCALALGQMHAPDALRDITLLLFDLSGHALASDSQAHLKVEPRKAAAQALALHGDRAALIPLTLKLTYPEGEHADVLQECMTALIELEDDRAVEILSPFLDHHDRFLAAHAALCLARTQNPEVVPLLVDALPQFADNPLRAVVLALSVLRHDAAHTALLKLLQSPREAVRMAAVETLADSRDPAVQLALATLSQEDKSPAVRNAAKSALRD